MGMSLLIVVLGQTFFLAGDSCGGGLIASSCFTFAKNGDEDLDVLSAIKATCLLYPVCDISKQDTESYRLYGSGYFITKAFFQTFINCYIGDNEEIKKDWRISPLLAPDELFAKFPPTLIITAGRDIYRSESDEFGRKLHEHGVQVSCVRFLGMIHAFFSNPGPLYEKEAMIAQDTISRFFHSKIDH